MEHNQILLPRENVKLKRFYHFDKGKKLSCEKACYLVFHLG